MDASALRDAVFTQHSHGRERGHYFLRSEDERMRGRVMRLFGKELVTFGSCSYLGLEFDERLIRGGQDAYERFGTQNSYSRGYLSNPLYDQLENELLREIFGGHHIVLLPSSTIAHQVAMPALITERDAVVSDHQVHRSVDDALTLQVARSGATKVTVRHGQLEQAIDIVKELSRKHDTVWFAFDGVYSMYGDTLPVSFLNELLAVAPNVRLYVDDAHGMSWIGKHGAGHFLSRFPFSERVVLATSLAKAFGVGGGVLVFANQREAEMARLVGGPYSFSGPMRPGDLGAAVASAKIHLTPEITERQKTLAEHVRLANELSAQLDIPLVVHNEAPIFFIALGKSEVVYTAAERLRDDGFHVNVSGFPAVPSSRGGLRIALSSIHTTEEVRAVFESLAKHLPDVLAGAGLTREEVDAQFTNVLPSFMRGQAAEKRESFTRAASRGTAVPRDQRADDGLVVEQFAKISEIDQATWDGVLGSTAYIGHEAMKLAERVFDEKQPLREHRWNFRYALVRNKENEVVAAAPFTTAHMKDDAFMQDDVSRELEIKRADDPYLHTSLVVSMGSLLSEGRHMYLAPGPQRFNALERLIEVAEGEMERHGSSTLILRDLGTDDAELEGWLNNNGFIPMPLLDSHVVDINWKTDEEYLESLGSRRKRFHVQEQMDHQSSYRVEVWEPGRRTVSPDEAKHLWGLYRNVSLRNFRINLFPFPESLIPAHLESPAWELLVVHLDPSAGGPEDGKPVAWGALHHFGDECRWLYCGIDYRYMGVQGRSAYRQMLLQIVRRAQALGRKRLHLGMGADLEKERFGSKRTANVAYVRADDTFSGTLLQEFVTNLAIRGNGRRTG